MTTYKTDQNPEFYDHDEPYDIIETIRDIQNKRDSLSMTEIGNIHPLFMKSHPPLFAKAVREKFSDDDMKRLIGMLKSIDSVRKGRVSFMDASKNTTITLAKQYQPELLDPQFVSNASSKQDK